MKNLKVSACILKSTRCPAGSQCRPVKTDPFPKQGTELKKKPGLFPRTVKHFRQCLSKHVNRQSCFNLVCRGPFVSCANIGTLINVLGADQTESRMGTRDWSYLLSQKKVSYTTLALWECVKQLKHFEKKKMSWQRCDNLRMFEWWYDLSDTQQWLVDLFDDEHYDNMLWQSLDSSTSSQ